MKEPMAKSPNQSISLVIVLLSAVLSACAGTKMTEGGTGSGGSVFAGVGGTPGLGDGGPTGSAGHTGFPIPPGCGDGINNQGGIEDCDDGNTLGGDGCNGACHVEPNWTCPPAGPCKRVFRCGDGAINPGEVCDDGNTVDGDGCSGDCTAQALGYACTPGVKCVLTSICGNKRVEPGESCDDGNTTAGDGCSTLCALEAGFVCPFPGSACMKAARCGDGTVNINLGEVCDDGNVAEGDGCSGDCRIKGAGCVCVPGQKCSCPEVRCGNGTIEGMEKCDDGNANSNDGCSSTCQIEKGYACPLRGVPCVPMCGDGMVIAGEQCDPAVKIVNMEKACAPNCRWAAGWSCTGSPSTECHATRCGDGKKEGLEGCDDGNTMPFDGCSSTCQVEPRCPPGSACAKSCGDGVLLGEDCEDGNTMPGDGCSANCTVEPGYSCTQPPLGDRIEVPVIYRDFLFSHPDFQPGQTGNKNAIPGLVNTMLDAEGKPTFKPTSSQGSITNATTFAQWYRTIPGTNNAIASTMTLWNNGNGGYVNRWGANGEQWIAYLNATWCDDSSCSKCGAAPAGKICLAPCLAWANTPQACFATPMPIDGSPLFFPVDGESFSPTSEASKATIGPPYAQAYIPEPGGGLHNFSFTSEVRYWFPYTSGKTYTFDFLGDDDVWVFVNGRLAVDLGGLHETAPGTITISSSNAATFGLTSGNVYEIDVFQAERQTDASSYKLTLSGFNGALSQCKTVCGDKIVVPPEQCDNGTAANTGGYNKCNANCTLGPFCGDGHVDPEEQCDSGANNDGYGVANGCGPGCKVPARCGDGVIQPEYGEQCDDGINDGRYGGCTPSCQRAAYCGDGKVQSPEVCDDGVNDGTYATCGDSTMPLPNCGEARHCGDGIVQEQFGEACEPKSSNDPECTAACRRPGICGDGVKNGTEQCDYGATLNVGAYGGCAAGCILAPHCGDGIKNGPEQCDDGVLDNSYGGCSPTCKLAPHCGDGQVAQGYEQCDLGTANGPDASCSVTCRFNVK
jgi:fibro-slime domain-containing protein